jgi:triosephosphate isomerase
LGYEDKVHDIEGEGSDECNRPNDNKIEGEGRHLGASRAARRRSSGALHGDQRSGAQLEAAGIAGAVLGHSNRKAARAGDQERLAAE